MNRSLMLLVFLVVYAGLNESTFAGVIDLNPGSFGNLTGTYNGSIINLHSNKASNEATGETPTPELTELDCKGVQIGWNLIDKSAFVISLQDLKTDVSHLEIDICTQEEQCALVRLIDLEEIPSTADIRIPLSEISCTAALWGYPYSHIALRIHRKATFFKDGAQLGKNLIPVITAAKTPFIVPLRPGGSDKALVHFQ